MQKDLPFKFTDWITDCTLIFYDFIKKIYTKIIVPQYREKDIKPLKYGRNRKDLDEASKRIMRKKLKNLK